MREFVVGMMMLCAMGCVAEVGPVTQAEGDLDLTVPSSNLPVSVVPDTTQQLYEGDLNPNFELPAQCSCEWRMWNSGELLCAGVVCSSACTREQRFCNETHACVPRQ